MDNNNELRGHPIMEAIAAGALFAMAVGSAVLFLTELAGGLP